MNEGPTSFDLGILSENRLLSQLDPREMEFLIGFSRVVRFDPEEVIFSKGDPGDSLYAILKGRVGIRTVSEDGKEILLNILEAGDVFGEIALLDGRERTASAVAMQSAELLRVGRAEFLPFLEEQPKLCLRLMNVLCERLRWTSDMIESTIFLDIPHRLAKRLLALVRDYGRETDVGIKLNMKLSQQDLANMLGVTRESVNKGIRSLQKEDAIVYEEGYIIILDTSFLESLVAGRLGETTQQLGTLMLFARLLTGRNCVSSFVSVPTAEGLSIYPNAVSCGKSGRVRVTSCFAPH